MKYLPKFQFLALVLLLGIALIGSTGRADAAEAYTVGGPCTTGQNATDWDTIMQCTGSVWTRANPFVANTVSIGTTSASANTALDVSGTIYSRAYNAGSSTTIDWSLGNVQYTTASCGSFTFSNMVSGQGATGGGSYTLVVEGTTSGTCSFSQSSPDVVTFKYPPNHGATTDTKMTVFSFVRVGSLVFIAETPGY